MAFLFAYPIKTGFLEVRIKFKKAAVAIRNLFVALL